MDNIEIAEVDEDGNPVSQNQKGKFAFRGHTIFDKIINQDFGKCEMIKNDWFIISETF